VLAHSGAREGKEMACASAAEGYWKRLANLQRQAPPRDLLLKKLGAARNVPAASPRGWFIAEVSLEGLLSYRLDRAALQRGASARRSLSCCEPTSRRRSDQIWHCYMQLVFVEEAFRTLKNDLGLRPIYHHKPDRIEAHLFVAFLAYCLSITLRSNFAATPRANASGRNRETSHRPNARCVYPTVDGRECF